MRTARACTVPLTFAPSGAAGEWTESYVIELLTPMIGGGVTSWQVDPAQPIRASEIKSQLRYWWRTMQDPATPMDALLRKESALFGHTDEASPIKLSVKQREATDDQLFELQVDDGGRCHDLKGCPGYVLFPLLGQYHDQAKQHRIRSFKLLRKFAFALHIACPDAAKTEIENAVKLWLLFGGLGARTRRGAGGLFCPTVHDAFRDETSLLAFLHRLPLAEVAGAAPFPVLKGGRLVLTRIGGQRSALQAWDELLGNHFYALTPPGYGDFRQGINAARPLGRKKTLPSGKVIQLPGRSHWPEADALRNMPGIHAWAATHAPRPEPGDWFPRAAYGLPIQFKFDKDSVAAGDPEGDFNLVPADAKANEGRWPSPLVLKIVRLQGQLYKLGLLLNQQIPAIRCDHDKRAVDIPPTAQPGAHVGKKLPPKRPFSIPPGHPHDGLFARLFPGVKSHAL